MDGGLVAVGGVVVAGAGGEMDEPAIFSSKRMSFMGLVK